MGRATTWAQALREPFRASRSILTRWAFGSPRVLPIVPLCGRPLQTINLHCTPWSRGRPATCADMHPFPGGVKAYGQAQCVAILHVNAQPLGPRAVSVAGGRITGVAALESGTDLTAAARAP